MFNTYFLRKNMVFALLKYTCTSSVLRGVNATVLLHFQISMKGREDQTESLKLFILPYYLCLHANVLNICKH